MDRFLISIAVALAVSSFICLIRVIKGPAPGDRIIGVNVLGTKTIVMIAIIAFFLRETYFLDVVMVYALISFFASLFIAREFEQKSGKGDSDEY